MHPSEHPILGLGWLRARWYSLTGWIVPFLENRARLLEERVADRIKDTLLDLGCDTEEESGEVVAPQLLRPPVTSRFAEAVHDMVEEALRQEDDQANENPRACSPQRIEQQVRALFDALLAAAIEQALRHRVVHSETARAAKEVGGAWARKYRRMMATESYWPDPSDSVDEGQRWG
jgi:hypothetical protein